MTLSFCSIPNCLEFGEPHTDANGVSRDYCKLHAPQATPPQPRKFKTHWRAWPIEVTCPSGVKKPFGSVLEFAELVGVRKPTVFEAIRKGWTCKGYRVRYRGGGV